MRRLILAIAAAGLLLAPAAFAAVDGTHHDNTTYTPGTNVKCAFCHSVTQLPSYTGYGQTGSFCIAVCHDGASTGFTAATPTAPGYFGDGTDAGRYTTVPVAFAIDVVAFTASHAANPAIIPDPDVAADVAATTWPHASDTTAMECTTCHAVHDGTNPPFLNAALGNTANADAFCQRCHTGSGAGALGTAGRYEDIANMGAHPTEFNYKGDGVVAAGADNAEKLARYMEIKAAKLYQPLDEEYADVAAFNADVTGGTGDGTGAWLTGGHFLNTTSGLPTATGIATGGQRFGCYSCHSAHQNSTTGGLNSWLGLGALEYNLPTAGGESANFCTACHGNSAVNVNNPGNTAFYHPTNEESAWVDNTTPDEARYAHDHADHGTTTDPNVPDGALSEAFPIVIDLDGDAVDTGDGVPATYLGAAGELLCTACHDVHGGQVGNMAIRVVDSDVQITSGYSVCLSCHKDSTYSATSGAPEADAQEPDAAEWHHPGLRAAYAAPWPVTAGTLGWAPLEGNLGELGDGLSCPDCHVFQATATRRATAHNW